MPFEANLRGRVYDTRGRVVGEEPIQVRPEVEDEFGGRGTFAGAIPFEIETAGPGSVEVAEISARDGSIVVSAMVAVTLTTSGSVLPDLTPPPRGWIAFKTPEEHLALIAPDGSRGVTVTEQAQVGSFAWSPDGRSLAFVRDGQLMLLSIEDTHVVPLTGPGTIRSTELAWSRDSTEVASERMTARTLPVAGEPDAWAVHELPRLGLQLRAPEAWRFAVDQVGATRIATLANFELEGVQGGASLGEDHIEVTFALV
jgi:hypothetical protein